MPTTKIKDLPDFYIPCRHAEHNPPNHWSPPPGVYEHVCPGCGNKQTFTVGGKAAW